MASPERSYTSPVRADQARQTRKRIVDAGAALFAERGYGATTIDAIAEAAGVSRKTVFDSVGRQGEPDETGLRLRHHRGRRARSR